MDLRNKPVEDATVQVIFYSSKDRPNLTPKLHGEILKPETLLRTFLGQRKSN